MKQLIHTWLPRVGSLLLLLFSLWCYTVYSKYNWLDTLDFIEDYCELRQTDSSE